MSCRLVAAANLNIDFRRPVPLGQQIAVTGSLVEKVGRKVLARGEIRLPDGEVAVVGRGIFVEARHLFENQDQSSGGSDD